MYNIVGILSHHTMSQVKHINFKYLLKADDDTFVCVRRVANFLLKQPPQKKDKIFAGVPTACNLPTNPHIRSQRWQASPSSYGCDVWPQRIQGITDSCKLVCNGIY